jgi:short-subunit dehydrogenase
MSTTSTAWVLITGASSGFGEEFARQYAARGRALVLVARRLDRLQSLADALRAEYGVKVLVERVDLADIDAIEQLHARLHAKA